MSEAKTIPPSTTSTFPPGTSIEEVRRVRDEAYDDAKRHLKNIFELTHEVRRRSGEHVLALPKEKP